MKKIFTLMLALACAMFVGVSCTPDNGDGTGNGGGTTPDPEFKITFDQATLSPSFAACTVEPKDETMLYVLPTNQDIEQYGPMGMPEHDGTPEGKVKAWVEFLAMMGMVYPDMEEVDGNWVCKGPQVEYPREYYRMDGSQEFEIYAAGFSLAYDETTSMPVVTLLTAVETTKVPFKAFPTITIAEEALAQTLPSAAGTVAIDCVLENGVEGAEWSFDCSAEWVSASWANNKLNLTYEANTAPVARKATIFVAYGDYTWLELAVTQAKDAAAEDVTFQIEVVESRFNGFVVNVTPSKKDVRYVLNAINYEENANLEEEASSSIGRSGLAYFTGDLQNHLIKTNVGSYQWYGTDFNIIAYAVDIKSENDEDWQGNPIVRETVTAVLSSVSSTGKQTVDIAKLPTLQWVTDGMTYNEAQQRYELEVVEGSTVTLKYVVTNPVEDGVVKVNGSTLYDAKNVIDGEPVVDQQACTVTFKIDAFDTTQKWGNYIDPTFVYTNSTNDTWNITTQDLRLIHVQAPAAPAMVTSVANLTAGNYYVAGKLASYTSGSNTYDWTNYPYHFWTGAVSAPGNTDSNSDLLTVNGNEAMELDPNMSSQDAAKGNPGVITLVAVEGKANTYYVKVGDQYLYCAVADTNRRMQLGSEPAEWVLSDHSKGGIDLVSNGVHLATAGATYNMIRSYKTSSASSSHQHGLVFFPAN